MLVRVMTATLAGVDGCPVIVEIDARRGLPALNVTGLADTTIREAGMRIRPAIMNSGYGFPTEKVTVNLVPAGRPKEGSHFDLPMALGIVMMHMGKEVPKDTAFFGELSLDGRVNHIRGALPLVMGVRKQGVKKVVLPEENAEEVSILRDIGIIPVRTLGDAVGYVTGDPAAPGQMRGKGSGELIAERKRTDGGGLDFAQVAGHGSVKRAITIAVAGHHGILMIGGPGCGKSMMAKRIPTIMPDLTYGEMIELTGIYSVAGKLSKESPVVCERPFRSPHHSISRAALIGGGARPRPGEMSLAHRGVLFLDELGEFDMTTIDAMRQPAEEGCVRISRNLEETEFPAQVMIVAAANPCKCGHLWDEDRMCTCSRQQIENYTRKLTGPFSDRIDLHVKMTKVPVSDIGVSRTETISSADMRRDVMRAVDMQKERYKGTGIEYNGRLDDDSVHRACCMTEAAERLALAAYEKTGISMRAYIKMLKTARTIADIEQKDVIGEEEMAEAITYRISDRGWT